MSEKYWWSKFLSTFPPFVSDLLDVNIKYFPSLLIEGANSGPSVFKTFPMLDITTLLFGFNNSFCA